VIVVMLAAHRTHWWIMHPPALLAGMLVFAVVLARATHRASLDGLALCRAWREGHRTRRSLERRLRALSAYDAAEFCGKGIPRRDWARFNDQLADVLWELRAGERRRGQ
jgi:hypothetical protein